jgi:hypothetical protein
MFTILWLLSLHLFFFCVYVTIDSWVPTSKTPSQLKRVQGSSTFVIFAQQKATTCKVKINHHIVDKAKSIIFNLDFDFFHIVCALSSFHMMYVFICDH